MATQYKKIQNKLHPKEAEQSKTDLKPKAIGWNTMDDIGHAMYGFMVAGMVIVYLNRRLTNLSENIRKCLIAVSSTLLLGSIVMLGYSVYLQFFK